MRKILFVSAVALLALDTMPARATTLPPLGKAPSYISAIAMGCGPGWIRGPYGGCHPMGYGYAYHPYAYGYGYHPYAYAHPYYRPYYHPYYHY